MLCIKRLEISFWDGIREKTWCKRSSRWKWSSLASGVVSVTLLGLKRAQDTFEFVCDFWGIWNAFWMAFSSSHGGTGQKLSPPKIFFPWVVFWRCPGPFPASTFGGFWWVGDLVLSLLLMHEAACLEDVLKTDRCIHSMDFRRSCVALWGCFWIGFDVCARDQWIWFNSVMARFFICCSCRLRGRGHGLWFGNWASLGSNGFFVIRYGKGGSLWTLDHALFRYICIFL